MFSVALIGIRRSRLKSKVKDVCVLSRKKTYRCFGAKQGVGSFTEEIERVTEEASFVASEVSVNPYDYSDQYPRTDQFQYPSVTAETVKQSQGQSRRQSKDKVLRSLVETLESRVLVKQQEFLELSERSNASRKLREATIATVDDLDSIDVDYTSESTRIPSLKVLSAKWFLGFSKAIEEEQTLVNEGVSDGLGHRKHYGPYIALLPADLLAMITIQTVLHFIKIHGDEIVFTSLAEDIGIAVKTEVGNIKHTQATDLWKELRKKVERFESSYSQTTTSTFHQALQQAKWDKATHVRVSVCVRFHV